MLQAPTLLPKFGTSLSSTLASPLSARSSPCVFTICHKFSPPHNSSQATPTYRFHNTTTISLTYKQDNPECVAEASPNRSASSQKKQTTPRSKAKKGAPLREYTLRITRPANDEDGDGEYMCGVLPLLRMQQRWRLTMTMTLTHEWSNA